MFYRSLFNQRWAIIARLFKPSGTPSACILEKQKSLQNIKFFPHLYSGCYRMVPCLSQLLDHLFQQLLAILCLKAGINKGWQNRGQGQSCH